MTQRVTIATLSSLAGFAHADLAEYDNRVDFDAATGAAARERGSSPPNMERARSS